MKRFISILVALALVSTSVVAFSASSVSATDYSSAYLDTVEYEDGATLPSATYNIPNSNQKPVLAAKGNALSIKPSTANKRAMMYYGFNKGYAFDNYVFGFDIVVNGATAITENQYNNKNVFWVAPGASYVKDEAGYKTAWRFNASGSNYPINLMDEADDNGNKKLKFGSANMLQGKVYTVKCYVDDVNNTYKFVVVDSEGVSQDAYSGALNAKFDDLGKLEMTICEHINAETEVLIDNIFIQNVAFGFINLSGNTEVTGDGTVSFSAIIPEEYTNPALYINSIFVEDISPVVGKTSYDIVATLPDGVCFGDAKFEIRATKNGQSVSAFANTTLTKEYKTPLSTFTGLSASKAEADGSYAFQDIRTSGIGAIEGGVYEIAFEFKATSTTSFQLGLRLSPDAEGVSAIKGNGTVFAGASTPGAWNYWTASKLSAGNVKYDGTTWNTAVFRVDYRNNAMVNNCPYTLTVNGVVVDEGTHKLQSSATLNGFRQVGFNHTPTGNTGHFRNVNIKEVFGVPEAESVKVIYANGGETEYTDTAVSSLDVDKLVITFDREIGNTTGNIKFVDSSGMQVENTSVTVSGKTVTIDYSGEAVLQTDNYKLVVGKAATVSGEALGASIIVPVALSNEKTIISPVKNGDYTDNVLLSAYVPDADKVVFYVNDEKVTEFTASDDGIYEYTYTPDVVGKKYFDAYAYSGSDVELVSTTFNCILNAQTMKLESDVDTANAYVAKSGSAVTTAVEEGAGKDGSSALKFTNTSKSKTYSSNNYISYSLGGNLYKQSVTEYDIKVEAGTQIWLEIGANINGEASTTSGYKTIKTMGTGFNGYAMFVDANGCIAGSNTNIAGRWVTVKHVVDFVNSKAEFYVDGVLVAEETITDSQLAGYENTTVMFSKYRMVFTATEDNANAVIYIDNYKKYQETILPGVKSVTAGGVEIADGIVAAGTDSITVELTAAYDNNDLDKFTSDLISVTLNGEAIEGVSVEVTDGANFTVSGLAGVKAGSVISIEVSDLAFYKGNITDKVLSIPVFVGDANRVCVLPIKLETNNAGTEILAYSKYINCSNADVNTYLVIAEYEDAATQARVKKAKFAPISMPANETGVVAGYIDGITSAEGCTVMLWDTNFAQLVSEANISE